MKHSPTPWTRGSDGLIFDVNGEFVTDTCGTSLPEGVENQKRIVECVNACRGTVFMDSGEVDVMATFHESAERT